MATHLCLSSAKVPNVREEHQFKLARHHTETGSPDRPSLYATSVELLILPILGALNGRLQGETVLRDLVDFHARQHSA